MGSLEADPPFPLPDQASPSLILTHPTEAERRHTWSLTHPKWGPALSHADYLDREAYATTLPLARDGGLTHWILTTASDPPDRRPVLSSCETLRKRAVRTASGAPALQEGIAFGIGSVFTDPRFRGRGYAARMLRELAAALPRLARTGETVLCSVLYSDIGKTFYAKKGWAPFASRHAAFPALAAAAAAGGGDARARVRTLGYHELAELCWVDEQLLRKELARRTGRAVALLPDLDQVLWHLMREDYMTTRIFGRTPTVRGAVAGERGRRVWAVWARGYYGGRDRVEGNTLHILRVVIEDEEQPIEDLAAMLRGVLQIAQAEAAEWCARDVQLWNPIQALEGVIAATGLEHVMVERDEESIPSMMWCGEGRTEEVEWVANERYGWC